MNAKEFIENKLHLLVEEYPNIKCSYKYEDSCSTHFIEVLPDSVYENDTKYAEAEENFISDFFDLNVPESICFVSENSLIKIMNPSIVIEGELYKSGFNLYSETLFETILQTSFTVEMLSKTTITDNNIQLSEIGECSYAMAA